MGRRYRAHAAKAPGSPLATPQKTNELDYANLNADERREAQEAVALDKKRLRMGNKDLEVYDHISSALTYLGRFDEAEEYCMKGLVIFPTRWELYNVMGVIRRRTGKPAAAIPYYDKAIKYHEKYEDDKDGYSLIFSNKAAALGDLKKYDDAIECYDIAIKANPDDNETRLNKYKTLILATKMKEAATLVLEEIKQGRDVWEFLAVYDIITKKPRSRVAGKLR